VEVYPAHGAGSLCGRSIGSERSSTIGKEKQFNYALQKMTRDDFIQMLTAELPERPGYFSRDAEINREGADAIEEQSPLSALTPERVERLTTGASAEAILLDTRPTTQFLAGHVPGSIHIALSGQYAAWAGALIGLDPKVIMVAEDPERLDESRLRLARVGIEKVIGYLAGGVEAWQRSGRPVAQLAQISAGELQNLLAADGGIQVVDVRRAAEWNSGHILQARHISLNQFAGVASPNGAADKTFLKGLDPARPVVTQCQSGYRSAIAASLLERAGFPTVVNLTGGMDAWRAQKLPVALQDAATAAPGAVHAK
jgi:rhodanese-related sulfurtransferase